MIRAFTLFMATASPAVADGDVAYELALETANRIAQAEYEAFGPVDIGVSSDETKGDDTVAFYRAGNQVENVAAEIVAVFDDTASICTWGYEVDNFPSLPRTAALAVKVEAAAQDWPTRATAQWSSAREDCNSRTNLATLLGDLVYIQALAVGPNIVYFGAAPMAPAS